MKRLLLILCLAARMAVAQEPERAGDLASLLPETTLVCFEADDLGGFQRWSQDTALGRIFMEPEVQVFWKNLKKSVDGALKEWAGTLGMVGLSLSDLKGIEIRRIGAALVDGSLQGHSFQLDAVLTLQARAGGEKIGKILEAMRQGLTGFLGVEFASFSMRGRTVWHTAIQASHVYFTSKGDRVVVTLSRERMDSVLRALDEGSPRSLRTAPRYTAILKRMGADRSALTFYADVRALHAKGVAVARKVHSGRRVDRFEAGWRVLGLDSIDAFAVADVPDGTGYRTELAITHTGRRGIFRVITPGTVNHRFARYAPEGCFCYGAEHWEAVPSLDAIVDLFTAFQPKGRAHVEAGLAEFRKHLGVDLKEDILKSLGSDWAGFLGAPPGGGLFPDMALFVSVKDKARLEQALDTAARRLVGIVSEKHGELAVKETLFRGMRIRFFESPDLPLAPAWAFGEDYLVLALNPATIRNAHVPKASLAGRAGFRTMMRKVPQGASSATWLNTRDIVAWAYNTVVPVLQSVQGMVNEELGPYGAKVNFHDLPPAEVITRHLGGTMFYTSPEEGCLRMGFVSPFGSSLVAMAAVTAGAAAGFLGEVVREGQREARHAIAFADRQQREIEMLRRRLAGQRAAYERRVNAIERQVAELRRLIEEGGK